MKVDWKLRGTLRSAGGQSLALTLPIEIVRDFELTADQEVSIEAGEMKNGPFAIVIVPIRGTNDQAD